MRIISKLRGKLLLRRENSHCALCPLYKLLLLRREVFNCKFIYFFSNLLQKLLKSLNHLYKFSIYRTKMLCKKLFY